MIYAGIDEAGYGPMLGPLCIGCTAFAIDAADHSQGVPNLWRTLGRAVCKNVRDKKYRIAIDDSKKLKGAKSAASHPLTRLERGVLSFLLTKSDLPINDQEFFERLAIANPYEPWYESITPLPVANDPNQLRVSSARLSRTLDSAGVRCEAMKCAVIDAGEFNRQIIQMRNKASVNICCIMRFINGLWKRWPSDDLRIVVDRQGGRTRYLEILQLSFEEAQIRILGESEIESRYQLSDGNRSMKLSFMREAESQHLPVALASMIAKYVRELRMLRLNRFFQAQMPTLAPTAGYVQDARRYLAQIEPIIDRLGLKRSELIRTV